jgi:hypothetical protein
MLGRHAERGREFFDMVQKDTLSPEFYIGDARAGKVDFL